MNNKIKKSVNKVMRKLTGFSLNHQNLYLETSLKIRFNDIWVQSEKVEVQNENMFAGILIIDLPKTEKCIENFERGIEDIMAKLHIKSKQLEIKE